MNTIRIITDSTGGWTREELEATGILCVPLHIHLQGEQIPEGTVDTFGAFYERLRASQAIPSTSQPSVGDFQTVFERVIAQGEDVVAVVLSAGLSGTFNSANIAAQLVDEQRITVVDSGTAAANLKLVALQAHTMASAGANAQDIATAISEQGERSGAVLTVDDLVYLKRGGRLNNAQYVAGKLLNILPILRARGCPVAPRMQWISPVIGSHLGPGAYGYTYLR